jgi:hypothetical protein
MVMTLLSHSVTFSILSPHKFADVAGNLMLMTLPSETGLSTIFIKSSNLKRNKLGALPQTSSLMVPFPMLI